MKLPAYFIKHPIIAIVLNALVVFMGILSLSHIGVREYPDVALPEFTVSAVYPNASAELVETSVTNPLEEQLAGVAGLDSLTSKSEQGQSSLYLNFTQGTNIDKALLDIREAVSKARDRLPDKVKDPQISRNINEFGAPFMALSLQSPGEDLAKEAHYASRFIKNALRSVKGVSTVDIWGPPYTMEIKLDPKRMYALGINGADVFNAISKKSLDLPVGSYQNSTPAVMRANLKDEEDFSRVFIKEFQGKPIYLSQIADIQRIPDHDVVRVRMNGKPALVVGVSKTSDANPLEVSNGIREQVQLLKKNLPQGTVLTVILDQAEFIRASLANIQSAILEAIVLVLLIVFVFLRNFRATLIPLVTIPISLIGGLILLNFLGFSINTLTLLAMVLAIGLVVDDAIVVLENISSHMERGKSALEAAIDGSREIGFAIVAMTLTLASVFFPIAFIEGAIGQLFIEFAIALAGSVIISGFVALTLSPMMARYILKPHDEKDRLWPQLDTFLDNLGNAYGRLLDKIIPHPKRSFAFIAGLFVICGVLYKLLPQETAPKEDRSLLGIFVPPVVGKTIDFSEKTARIMEEYLAPIPEQQVLLSFIGPWGASTVLTLKEHGKRNRSPAEIVKAIQGFAMGIPSADAWPWSWDSGLPGMGAMTEQNELTIAIQTVGTYRDLFKTVQAFQQKLSGMKVFKDVRHSLKLDNRSYNIETDTTRMARLNLDPTVIAKTIEIFFSGDKNLTFNIDDLPYNIWIKGQNYPWNLSELFVTNPAGKKISIASVASIEPSTMPKNLEHCNQMRTDYLTVTLNDNQTIPQGMNTLLKSVKAEPSLQNFQWSWRGLAKSFEKESNTLVMLFIMALVFIYAILTIQFESFKDPFIVLGTVPLAGLGALGLLLATGQSINIYTQIGFITLVGLITKHGILIVEFANQLHQKGAPRSQAVKEAALRRLRPILMTSGAMVLGAVPLILSHSAGYEARHAIGFVLIGGLLLGSILTLVVIPAFYLAINSPNNLTKKDVFKFIEFLKNTKSLFTRPR